jgi:hypothetical protein
MPWTLVCEDLLLKGHGFDMQHGLFALQEFVPGQAILRYRGDLVARCAPDSPTYWNAVASVLDDGRSSYLIEISSGGLGDAVDLINGESDRDAGAKVANSAHGLKHLGRPVVNNGRIEPDGSLVVTGLTVPLTGLHDMFASAIFVDYDSPSSRQPKYFDRPVPQASAGAVHPVQRSRVDATGSSAVGAGE